MGFELVHTKIIATDNGVTDLQRKKYVIKPHGGDFTPPELTDHSPIPLWEVGIIHICSAVLSLNGSLAIQGEGNKC